jgi:hypothetical protein
MTEYRRAARKLRDLLPDVTKPEARKLLEDLAAEWDELADTRQAVPFQSNLKRSRT